MITFAWLNVLIPLRRFATAYRGLRSWPLLLPGAMSPDSAPALSARGPLFSVPIMLMLGFSPLMIIGVSQVLQIASATSPLAPMLRNRAVQRRGSASLPACSSSSVALSQAC